MGQFEKAHTSNESMEKQGIKLRLWNLQT